MQTAEKFDVSTLVWLKAEIDESLKRARIVLEEVAGDPTAADQLSGFVEALHQVHGTLKMVELESAARFAHETEAFAVALHTGKVPSGDAAFELLMRAVLQLPDFLEDLQEGHSDSLLPLLPLINELRSLRGEKPLGELALFRPSLDVAPPGQRTGAIALQAIAVKARPYCQTSLANLLRNREIDSSLAALAKVIDALFNAAERMEVRQVFWVSSGLLEALQNDGLELGAEIKQVLGKVEQLVRFLSQSGEREVNAENVRAVTRVALYYLTKSTFAGERIAAIKEAFHLERFTGERTGPLRGFNAELKRTVAADLMEELSRVKDLLDVFVRGQRDKLDSLDPIVEGMQRLAETLELLRQETLHATIAEQAEAMRRVRRGELTPDDTVLMSVAGALLAVESALGDWGSVAPLEQSDEAEDGTAVSPGAEAEHARVVRQVMKESKDDLVRAREAVNDYLEGGGDRKRLADIRELFHRIVGSLTLLNYGRVAQVVLACSQFARDHLLEKEAVPGDSELDRFADAMMSIEYYLEAFVEGRVHPGAVLEVAEHAVAALGYPVGSLVPEAAPVPETVDSSHAGQEAEAEPVTVVEVDRGPAVDSTDPPPLETVEASEPEPVAVEASADESPGDDEFDDEILQVFLEEADEELERIQRLRPAWEANPTDVDTLKDYRRSFHTLKGSGRLVGADGLGEFAWAIENMLNKVIDGAVNTGPELFQLLREAERAVPELIANFREGTPAGANIPLLVEVAHAFSRGEVPHAALATIVDDAPSASNIEEIPEDADRGIDPELLEIFSKEADDHLATIETFVAQAPAGAASNHALLRALHTLKGSSRIAGLTGLAAVNEVLERCAKALQSAHREFDSEVLAVLEADVALARASVAHLHDRALPLPDAEPLLSRAEALYASLKYLEQGIGPEAGLADAEEGASDTTVDPLADPILRAERDSPDSSDNPPHGPGNATGAISTDPTGADPATWDPYPSADPVAPESVDGAPSAAVPPELEAGEPGPEAVADHALPHDGFDPAPMSEAASSEGRLASTDYSPGADPAAPEVPDHPSIDTAGTAPVDQVPTAWFEGGAPEAGLSAPGGDAHDEEAIELSDYRMSEAERNVSEDTPETAEALPTDGGETADDYDPELVDLFLEEGSELLDSSDETLQRWLAAPHDRDLVAALQRDLHTLKGSARMAGVSEAGDLGHSLESAFEAIVEGRCDCSDGLLDLVQQAHDRLAQMLDRVRERQPLPSGEDLIERIERTVRGDRAAAPVADEPHAVSPPEAPADVSDGADESDGPARFVARAAALVGDFATALRAWQAEPADDERHLRMVQTVSALEELARRDGVDRVADLAAATGPLLVEVRDGRVPVSDELFGLLLLIHDRFSRLQDQCVRGLPPGEVQDLIDSTKELIARHRPPEDKAEQQQDTDANRRRTERIQHEMVRVRRDLMDDLVNYAGEVSIYRSRIEQQMNAFRGNLDELGETVERLRGQLRQFDIETEAQITSRYQDTGTGYEEFDPLEFDRFTNMQQLSRSMMESLGDVRAIEEILLDLSRESETLLLQQARVNTELQEHLLQTRMVQLVENAPRLRRVVRQTTAELDRSANLSFTGAEVEMDRRVVERLMAPLEHMLRNAVAHGIEPPAERLAAGKPEAGVINIALAREGAEVVVRVSDDGRGIDIDAVKHKAVERGLMEPHANLGSQQVMQFIFEPGFSTATTLTQVAGRGVGMDVVNSEIRQLGGVLEIDTQPGQGTRFTIRLPLTLSVSRALLVHAGEEPLAIPLMSVQGIERIDTAELERMMQAERPAYRWVGEDYDLLSLRQVLGIPESATLPDGSGKLPVLLAQSGEQRVALLVDRILGSREVVIKSLGPQVSTMPSLAGATILSDGGVALVLELPALIRKGLARRHTPQETVETPLHGDSVPTVMIVDDSITVRAVTKRLLKRHNLNAVAAKDGVDAISLLDEITPDIILLDIEMPRMDGFELATHIRNTEKLKNIPIIMITSRTGEKHRKHALELGVNEYMGKPYAENDLLDNIQKLLGDGG